MEVETAMCWPEARLIALVVISAKLMLGLDGIERIPKERSEASAVRLNIESWKEFLSTIEVKAEINWTEADVLKMNGEQLDKYMDWYEKTWCQEGSNRCECQRVDRFMGFAAY